MSVSENGPYISVDVTPVIIRPSGSVAIHEAGHVVASEDGIVSATIIRQGNALGTTVPVRLTPANAGAGAIAEGDEHGAAQDEGVARYRLRVTWGESKAQARAALAGKEIEIKAVASALEEKGTIGPGDVKEAHEKAHKIRKGIAKAKVLFISSFGRKVSYEKETTQTAEEIVNELDVQDQRDRQAAQDHQLPTQEELIWTEKDDALRQTEAEVYSKEKELVEV
jgi:hypothetical protein